MFPERKGTFTGSSRLQLPQVWPQSYWYCWLNANLFRALPAIIRLSFPGVRFKQVTWCKMAIVVTGSLRRPAGSSDCISEKKKIWHNKIYSSKFPRLSWKCHQYFSLRVKVSIPYKNITFNHSVSIARGIFISDYRRICGNQSPEANSWRASTKYAWF